MKELIHLVSQNSELNIKMQPEIDKFVKANPAVSYSEIKNDSPLFAYYSKKYNLTEYPVFIGLVDGILQDGHMGFATSLILESLIN